MAGAEDDVGAMRLSGAVTVVFSPGPREVVMVAVPWCEGLTVALALARSGLLARHAQIDPSATPPGVWGRSAAPGDLLQPGDRVELYRPLTVDPKEARRQRYRAQGPRRKPPQPRRPRPPGPVKADIPT